jgi:hypothetical protein
VFEAINILIKVLAKKFYQQNAAFFLLIGTLAFGFMSKREHEALATFFVSMPALLLIPFSIWVLYLFKMMRFNIQATALRENNFLFNVSLMPTTAQFFSSWVAILLQFSPAILYGLFLILISLKLKVPASGCLVALSLFALSAIATIMLVRTLGNIHSEKKISALKKLVDVRVTRNLTTIYAEWIFRREPFMVLGTKIFTCVLLWSVTQLYRAEAYDARLLSMAIAVAFSSSVMIIFNIHAFGNVYFPMLRSVPLSLAKRLVAPMGTALILIIPEIAITAKYFPENLSLTILLQEIIFGFSIHFLLYTALYRSGMSDHFVRTMFILLFVLLILILFKIPLLLFASVNLLAGVFLFARYFYSYQPEAN